MNRGRGRNSSHSASGNSSSSSSHTDGKFGERPARSFRGFDARPAQSRYSTARAGWGSDPSATRSAIGSQRAVLRGEGEEHIRGESADVPSIVGNCPFMCPERERAQRERLRDLAVFERPEGNPGKSSSSLAVKKALFVWAICLVGSLTKMQRMRSVLGFVPCVSFARQRFLSSFRPRKYLQILEANAPRKDTPTPKTISIRDIQASDVRPLPVLEVTLRHLLELFDSSDHPFVVIHDFIFDRTRSIRQDLSMQHIADDHAILMYEKMVRFHVISRHRLRRCGVDDPTVASLHHLNTEQLTKSLATLYNLYDINHNSNSSHENEAEFRSLYILLNLGSYGQSTGEPLSLWFRQLSASVIRSKKMDFARRVLRFHQMGNYWRFFFTVANEATYLQFCVIEPYANEVRAKALASLNQAGYKPHPYPLSKLARILRLKEQDMESFCHSCGLETSVDEAGNKVIPCKQTTFSHTKEGFKDCEFLGLEQFYEHHGLQE